LDHGLLLLPGEHEDENELPILPFRATNEKRAIDPQHGVRFDQNLLLLPKLEMEINPSPFSRPLGIDLQKEVPRWHHPRFVLPKDILIVMPK
jgi:hypothetical protein